MACSVSHPAVVYENQQYTSSVTSNSSQQSGCWELQQVERLRRLSMMSRTSQEDLSVSSGRSTPRRRISHGSDHGENDCPVNQGGVVYVQGSDGHFIPACPIGYAFHYLDVKQRYKRYFDASGSSTVAIDNKIEQAMDLVKSHLMFAVREEVEVLKERIKELMDRISQLEYENSILRQQASQETLAQLGSKTTPTNS